MKWDLIVVGAGPAGSAAAMGVRKSNPDAKVLILDKEPPGRDKVCGDGVGPDVVDALRELGAEGVTRAEESVSLFRVSVSEGPELNGRSAEPGYVIPRAELDRRLLECAMDSGARFEQGKVVSVSQNETGATVNTRSGSVHECDFVVAADGAYSPIRRSLGLAANTGKSMAVAIRGYYTPEAGGDDVLKIIWDRNFPGLAYAWLFPLSDGSVNVGYGASLVDGPLTMAFLKSRLKELLPAVPVEEIAFRGHQLPLATTRPELAHGRVLLAGDAASLINPLSGEGIVYALISGTEAGRAAGYKTSVSEVGRKYEREMRSILGKHHRHANAMAAIANPATVSLAINSAKADDRATDSLIGLALGTGSLALRDTPHFAKGALKWVFGGAR